MRDECAITEIERQVYEEENKELRKRISEQNSVLNKIHRNMEKVKQESMLSRQGSKTRNYHHCRQSDAQLQVMNLAEDDPFINARPINATKQFEESDYADFDEQFNSQF